MQDYRKRLMDLEHGDLPDPVAEAVSFFLREQDKREERLTDLASASGIASARAASLEKIMTEAAFSQGGQI